MEKQYSDRTEKINKIRNAILRAFLITLLILTTFLTIAMVGSTIEYGSSHHSTYGYYVNGIFTGNTVTRSDTGPYLKFAFIAFILSAVNFAFVYSRKGKDIHDFRDKIEEVAHKKEIGLANASDRRKKLYAISKYAGFTGADRFACGCILRGIIKLGLSFLGITLAIAYFTDDLFYIVFLVLSAFLWVKDTRALKYGTYTDRKRKYIE